jgi:hypothetical protein
VIKKGKGKQEQTKIEKIERTKSMTEEKIERQRFKKE